jgi:hypothetical protein
MYSTWKPMLTLPKTKITLSLSKGSSIFPRQECSTNSSKKSRISRIYNFQLSNKVSSFSIKELAMSKERTAEEKSALGEDNLRKLI